MRRCFQTIGSLQLRPQQCRSLRTSTRSRPWKPAVNQLSNAELLNLVNESKEDASSPLNPEVEFGKLEQRNEDARSEEPSAAPFYLPESPLTSQRLLDARTRHKAEKPLPSKERSAFQLKLHKNPFGIQLSPQSGDLANMSVAQALATPPRLCLLTGLRIPSYFQIPFGLAAHPKTGAPWHLPRLAVELASNRSGEDGAESSANDTTPSSPQASPITERKFLPPSEQSARVATGTHFLASRQVLEHVSSLQHKSYGRLMPFRWKEDSSIKIPDIIWRQDMDTFVLEILRKKVLKNLIYLASRSAAYIADCRDHDHISEYAQVGAVLWLGPGPQNTTQERAPSEDKKPASHPDDPGPKPYAMHYYRSHYIPVYNLPTLLGPEHLRTVRESSSLHFGDHYAVIKAKRATVKVQLELWRLLGYLAQDKEVGNSAVVSDTTAIDQELDFDTLLGDDRFEEPLINVLAN